MYEVALLEGMGGGFASCPGLFTIFGALLSASLSFSRADTVVPWGGMVLPAAPALVGPFDVSPDSELRKLLIMVMGEVVVGLATFDCPFEKLSAEGRSTGVPPSIALACLLAGLAVSGTPELEPKERVTMLPGWRELPPVSERGWARMPKGDPRGALGEPGEKGEASGLGVGRMVGG